MSSVIRHKQVSYYKSWLTAEIENSQSEKLLEVTNDIQLSFEKPIDNMCSRAKAKLVHFLRQLFLCFSNRKKC